MPHQCVHCGKIYETASNELLSGCSCGSRFFFFIKQKQFEDLKIKKMPVDLGGMDKKQVEKDVREMIGIEEEDVPIILDLESVRVVSPGKFEIDVVNLFNKKRPLIFKLEEGKYIIDLSSTFRRVSSEKLKQKIKDPEEKKE